MSRRDFLRRMRRLLVWVWLLSVLSVAGRDFEIAVTPDVTCLYPASFMKATMQIAVL